MRYGIGVKYTHTWDEALNELSSSPSLHYRDNLESTLDKVRTIGGHSIRELYCKDYYLIKDGDDEYIEDTKNFVPKFMIKDILTFYNMYDVALCCICEMGRVCSLCGDVDKPDMTSRWSYGARDGLINELHGNRYRLQEHSCEKCDNKIWPYIVSVLDEMGVQNLYKLKDEDRKELIKKSIISKDLNEIEGLTNSLKREIWKQQRKLNDTQRKPNQQP